MTAKNLLRALFALFILAFAPSCTTGPHSRASDRAAGRRCDAAILIYHEVGSLEGRTVDDQEYIVSPDHFARQMAYLKHRGYKPVPYARVADCVAFGQPLPEKAVVITFDDSEAGPYREALPVLRKYHFPATFFIISDYVGDDDHLTWDQIRQLDRLGMTIGGHTRTHENLTKLTELERRKQLVDSKRETERQLGHAIDYFAFPFGQFDDASEDAVAAAGFRAARCSDGGTMHTRDHLFSMRAFGENDDMNAFVQNLRF